MCTPSDVADADVMSMDVGDHLTSVDWPAYSFVSLSKKKIKSNEHRYMFSKLTSIIRKQSILSVLNYFFAVISFNFQYSDRQKCIRKMYVFW